MQVVDAQGDAEPGVDVAITLVHRDPAAVRDSGLENGLFTIVTTTTQQIREGDGIGFTSRREGTGASVPIPDTVDECRAVHKASSGQRGHR